MKSIAIVLVCVWTTAVFSELPIDVGENVRPCTTTDDCPPSYVCADAIGNDPNKRCVFQVDNPAKIVAFKASRVPGAKPNIDKTLVFQKIMLNVGDSYDNDTGEFTAPCSGLYSFAFQLSTTRYSRITAYIMIEDKEAGRLYAKDTGTATMSSSDALAVMTVGERAYVKVIARAGSLLQNRDFMNSFSGFLVHEIKNSP